MAITRINTDQITDLAITPTKLAERAVTSSKLDDNLIYDSNLTVTGSLTVTGTTTTVDTSNLTIDDPLVVISRNASSGSVDSGFIIERGTDENVAIIYKESDNAFVFGYTIDDGTTVGNVDIVNGVAIKAGSFTTETGLSLVNSELTTEGDLFINVGGTINVGTRITGLAEPIADNDAATKEYVDLVAETGFIITDGTNATVISGGDALLLTGTTNQIDFNVVDEGDEIVVKLTDNVSIVGNFTAGGNVSAVNTSLSGTLNVTGNATVGSATVVGATLLNGAVTLGDAALDTVTVTGTATFAESATFTSGFEVAPFSTVSFGDNRLVDVASPQDATDAVNKSYVDTLLEAGFTLSDGTNTSIISQGDTMLVSGTANQVTTAVAPTGDSVTIGLTPSVTISGTLTSGSVATGSATVTGDATVGGTLGVTGATTVTTVTASGAATFNGDVTLGDADTDTVSVLGSATFAESATFDSGFAVSAASTIDAGANRVTNVAAPTVSTDAATKGYVDAKDIGIFNLVDGSNNTQVIDRDDNFTILGTANQVDTTISATDTLTISLTDSVTLPGTLTSAAVTTETATVTGNATVAGSLGVTGLTTVQKVTANDTARLHGNVELGNEATDVITVAGTATFAETVALSGATSTANVVLSNGATVTGLATPVNATDAATKGYVDAKDTGIFNLKDGANNTEVIDRGDDFTILGTANQINTVISSEDTLTVSLTPSVTITGALTSGSVSTGSAAVTGNTTVGGSLTVTGASTLNDNVTVNANATVTGDTVLGDSALDALTVNATATFTESANLAGATSNANIVLTDGATVTGLAAPATATDAATKGYVDAKDIDIFTLSDGTNNEIIDRGDTFTINGVANQTTATISATDTLTVGLTPSVTITGALTSGSVATGALSATNATLTGTLGVAGATTLSSTLAVNGTSTLNNVSVVNGSTIDAGDNRVTNVADPVALQDAVTLAHLNSTISNDYKEKIIQGNTWVEAFDDGIDPSRVDTAIDDVVVLTVEESKVRLAATATLDVGSFEISGNTIRSKTGTGNTIIIDPYPEGSLGTVIIEGDLQVTGTTTTFDSTNVVVQDPILELGSNTEADILDRGLKLKYFDTEAKAAFVGINRSENEFVFIPDATDTADVFTGALGDAAFGGLRVTDLTAGKVVFVGADGKLVNSPNLTFDGSVLTVTGNIAGTTLSVSGASTLATATFSGNVAMGGNSITNLAAPVNALDAANKQYVDAKDIGIFSISDGTNTEIIDRGDTFMIEGTANEVEVEITATDTLIIGLPADVTISNALTVTGAASAASATVTGNATVGGTLGVTGATTVSTITASGLATFNGNVVLGDDVTDAVTVNATTTFGAPVAVNSDIVVANGSIVDMGTNVVNGVATPVVATDAVNKTYVDSRFANMFTISDGTNTEEIKLGDTFLIEGTADEVAVEITATDTLIVGLAENVAVKGTLGVAGNTTLSGTATVTGATTLQSSLSVTGATTLAGVTASGAATFNGATTVANTLDVSGAATFDGTIALNGAVTVAASTAINAGANRVTNVANPTQPQDAATKAYVDAKDTGIFSVSDGTNTEIIDRGDVFTINGTANEVEVLIAHEDTLTIGLPADVTVSNSLTVTGPTQTASLNVSNATTVGGSLGVTGATTLTSVTASGAATFNGNVNLGDAALDTITVAGTATFAESATFSNGFAVSAASTVNAGGNVVNNVATPVVGTDAVNKAYVDARDTNVFTLKDGADNTQIIDRGDEFVILGTANQVNTTISATDTLTVSLTDDVAIAGTFTAGGAISGASISVAGNATVGGAITVTGDATINGNVVLGDNSMDDNITLNGHAFVEGDVTVALGSTLDFGANKLRNVDEPTLATDAATKAYVDSKVEDNNQWQLSDGIVTTTIDSDETLTVVGTANQTTVAVAEVGTDATFTVGLTDNVTIADSLTVTNSVSAASASVSGNTTTGTLTVSGASTLNTVTTSGNATLASAQVSNLTATEVVFAGVDGALTTDQAFVFTTANGLAVTNNITSTEDVKAVGVLVGNGPRHAEASLHIDATDSMILAKGTTAQRPSNPVQGMQRYNTSINAVEIFDGTEWNSGVDFTIITSQLFTGDGVTTVYTLDNEQTTASVVVSINGVVQQPVVAYGVSGTTLTFTEAPADGDVIDVRGLTTTNTVTALNDSTGTTTVTVANDTSVVFKTSGIDRHEINADGHWVPLANEAYDLGTMSNRWRDLYLSGSTINLGGLLIKNEDNTIKFFHADGVTPASIEASLDDDVSIDGGEY